MGDNKSQSGNGGAPQPPPPPPPVPPPLPPLPAEPISSMHGYGSSLPPLGPSPYSAYGNYGAYGRYGSYGSGYGTSYGLNMPYGMGAGGAGVGTELSVARLAEERVGRAFQGLDNVVHAVSSVSMLLESSSNAVQSSFRAIIGVAEQMSRVKAVLSSLILSTSLFRFLRWLYRRLLVLLRLRPNNFASSAELAWSEELGSGWRGKTDYSSLLFLLISLGGPWLLYKAASSLLSSARESQRWVSGEGPHYVAKALYDFNGTDRESLSLSSGQSIRVAPKELQPQVRGWLLAADMEGSSVGFVPINYVKITARYPPPDKAPLPQCNIQAFC